MSEREAILIVGGGGHGLVVAEAARAVGGEVVGFLDDERDATLAGAAKRLGGLSLLEHQELLEKHRPILGLGDLSRRRSLIGRLGDNLATVIHPSAHISPSAKIEPGAFVGPHAVVHAEARVETHAIINSAAVVEHHCVVGANAHIAPGAALGGDARVERDALVGLGARVLPGVRVGAGCTVGAGSAVICDMQNGVTAVGVPARVIER